jgi:hypothetical protein
LPWRASAAALARAQLLGKLVAARLAVELVLGLVGCLRLGEDLASDPLVVCVRPAARARGDLGAIDRDHAGLDEPGLRAEREHGAEELSECRLVAAQEAGDRRVVGNAVGRDHPVGDVLAAVSLDRARGALLRRVGVEHERDHHRGLIGGAAVAVVAVVGVEIGQVHFLDRVDDEPR